MNNYDTIIFDLDGTLLDTLGDLTDSVNYVMKKYGHPLKTLAKVRSSVGNGIFALIESVVPSETSEKEIQRIYLDFKSYYSEHYHSKTVLYPGILELLDYLKKFEYKMAIVSNKSNSLVSDLNRFYFKNYIKVAIGEKDSVRKKPYPDTVLQAIEEIGSTLGKTLYIGDSEVDVQTAKNAEIDCLLVSWGFRDKSKLINLGANRVVDNVSEIISFLEE